MIRAIILTIVTIFAAATAFALPPIPTDGTTGHTIVVRAKIAPKIIDDMVERLDGSGMVYTTTVSRLNFGVPYVAPDTFRRLVYWPRQPDYWSDDAKLRSELWEDTAGVATWGEVRAAFPELPGLLEAAIRGWGEATAKSIASPYSESEQKTWPYQREEAKAWEKDSTVPTPFCDGLAARRGVPRELFISKVLENTNLFESASQQIFGTQQALLDLLTYSPFLKDILSAMRGVGITEVKR